MRLKWTMVAVALCAAVTVAAVAYAAGSASDVRKVIRAQRFEVTDGEGRVRAILGTEGDSSALVLFDDKGRKRAGLTLPAEGVAVMVTGELRADTVRIPVPTFVSVDEDGNLRGVLALLPGLKLTLSDEQGRVVWSAP